MVIYFSVKLSSESSTGGTSGTSKSPFNVSKLKVENGASADDIVDGDVDDEINVDGDESDVNDDDDMDDVPEGKRQCRLDSLFKAHLKQSVFALG